jgi:uncharacterized protein
MRRGAFRGDFIMEFLGKVIAAALIAVGLAGAGWLGGQALIESRQPIRTVTVKGLSERPVMADLGFWPIKFVATGPTLEDARAELESADAAVRQFLAGQGFPEESMRVQNILVEDRLAGYNASNTPDLARFVLTEEFLVTSNDVEAIAEAARNVGEMLRVGVVFSSDSYNAGPSYVFTGLNDLKTDMLAEATQRARASAEEFAREAGAAVGTIQTANQGVFEILAEVEIPDQRSEKQIDKKVRVVTTITYFLE